MIKDLCRDDDPLRRSFTVHAKRDISKETTYREEDELARVNFSLFSIGIRSPLSMNVDSLPRYFNSARVLFAFTLQQFFSFGLYRTVEILNMCGAVACTSVNYKAVSCSWMTT